MIWKPNVVCVGLLVLLAAVAAASATSQTDTVANLRAFAKLYGYVRFFHPSDEASSIDWDRFAVLGAKQVAGCGDEKALRTALAGLFGPLAPSVQVYGAGVRPQAVKLPGDSATCLPVCWQHKGLGLQDVGPYHSQRTNRPKLTGRAGRFVVQYVGMPPGDSTDTRRLRVRVRARAEGVEPDNEPVVFAVGIGPGEDPMAAMARASSLPLSSATWQAMDIEAALAPGQEQAAVGVANGPSSTLWADDFEAWVSSGDSWARLELKDPGFEDSVSLEESPVWMYVTTAEKAGERPFAGAKCLRVTADTGPAAFEGSPAPGEFVDKPLDRGLSCRVPLCLWSKGGHTLPRGNNAVLERLRAEVGVVVSDSLADPGLGVRLGDVIIVWNAMQHFYPYFEVGPVDWDSVLTGALAEALSDSNRADFFNTLRLMAVALTDGHAGVSDPTSRRLGRVPAALEFVEGRITVLSVASGYGSQPGDVLLSVNGRPAVDVFEQCLRYCSGSPQYRRARALVAMLRGPRTDTLALLVERGTETLAVRAVPAGNPSMTVPLDPGDSIRVLGKGIWYVDLNRAPMEAIDSAMSKLAKAKGVVFDLRGYPNNNHDVISHLLGGNEQRGEKWMFIPRITWPDRERIAGWDGIGWTSLQPKEPRIGGKVVFLTDGTAVSYAESFMGYIEGFKLADIVGGPTAGTNGNVNPISLPGGFSFYWTGMKVTKFDGSQHHLIGIQPTVPLERTLKAVREGRDEYIEKAVELIRG